MADQTPDPAQMSDDQLDNLLDQLAQRAAERDDLDFPGSGPSRRSVLATLLGAGGVGLGASQLATAASASWNSASGTLGTDSTPLKTANVRDLDAKQTTTGTLDFSGGGLTQEGQSSPNVAIGGTFNITSNFNKTNFGLGVISRSKSIGTALFEFERFQPQISLIYDSNGKYSTTQGNSGTTNIYYNNSDELIVENQKTGGDSYRVVLFSQ